MGGFIMAFSSATPTAPWTTGISGSGTWAQLVTFINNPAIISQTGDVFTITGLIDINAIMTALTNSVIINKTGGGFSIGNTGAVTFGRLITTPSGVILPADGCLMIDEPDAYARGVDNYTNTKCIARNGSYFNMYASQYINKNTLRSDFDCQSGSNVKFRNVRVTINSGVIQYDHYAGNLDIDGLTSTHSYDTTGSILELMTTSVITKLNNMVPYLNNTTSRQCTLWLNKVTLSQWGGDNFAPWDLSGYYRFSDPKSTGLIMVDRSGTAGSSQCETRTTDFLCLDSNGPVTATVSAINNVDELDAEGIASATTGIFTGMLKRKLFPGGSSSLALGYTRTPHVVWARKWGYKTLNNTFQANPTAYEQARLTDVLALSVDSNITLTSSAASAIAGVTIASHGKAVVWNGKAFSLTVTADPSLTLSQVYHSVAYQCSELTTLMPRAAARTSGVGHNYNEPWLGATGDTDLTLVVVQTTRTNNIIFGNQISASIGTASVGLSCRTSLTNGVIFQNYITDLFPTANYTAAQQQVVNPDGGEQLLISIGRYNSTAKTITVWSNNQLYATTAVLSNISRGVAQQYFRLFGQGNTTTWEAEQHTLCEVMGFDRAVTDSEATNLSCYLANKWHHMSVGNIVPSGTNNITSANFPVNSSGVDWMPSDFVSGQGPIHWVSMASPNDYTVSGSNITAFKDKVTGVNIVNSTSTAYATVVNNYRKFIAHQLFDSLTTTNRGIYPDGRYRGVRVIDTNGNPFPGIDKMMADDGTYFIPPVVLTITANISLLGAEIRIYDLDNAAYNSYGTELAGVESNTSSTFSYTGVAGNLILIQILLSGYIEYAQQYTIPNTSATYSASLSVDNVN
jgi:hypothetical protein